MVKKRKEREEKECLNCGESLQGRYCHNCGQENIELREPIGRVFLRLFEGLTYFDSKFFKTSLPLLFKPGYLTRQYLGGKKLSFLNPVKMYFFLSFIYFLLFFWMGDSSDIISLNPSEKTTNVIGVIDTAESNNKSVTFGFEGDNWLSRKVKEIKERARKDGKAVTNELSNLYSSNIPKLVFLAMPFLALFLKLFYRKRYFIEHLIHAIHLHSFGFVLFIVLLLIGQALPNDDEFFSLIGIFIMLLYLVISFKSVYQQKWIKTIFKTVTILMMYSIVLGIGFLMNIIITLALA